MSRVVPVIEGIRDASLGAEGGQGVTISVDTRRAAVAAAAVAAGAHAVNDVSGGRFDPEMFAAAARAEVPLIMMHMRCVQESWIFLVYISLYCSFGAKSGSALHLAPSIGFSPPAGSYGLCPAAALY